MEFTVALDSPFSLEHTLESGQVFRWERRGEWWYGVVAGSALKARQEGDTLRCVSSSDFVDSVFVKRYFRLEDDLDHILAALAEDEPVTRAGQKFYGLRLVRQDRWECLASFILATNSNIPRIKKMVASICSEFGERAEFEGEPFHTFPTADALAGASVAGLVACGLGYRASFLRHISQAVAGGRVEFDKIEALPYLDARKLLLSEAFGQKVLLGVGPKVADCVLLYSFGKDESFPIDVWITKVLAEYYPRLLGPVLRKKYLREGKVKLSPGDYAKISQRARSHFGPYAGYAQQYLFMAAREESA